MLRARRVLDRFAAADGGLLAAGIAYNTTLALIPLAVIVAAIGGFVLTDPDSRGRFIDAIVTLAPPLKGVLDEIVAGLSAASTPLSLIGFVFAFWGTSRLYASLESAVGLMFVATGRRGLMSRTVRRLGSVLVLSMVVTVALVVVPALSVAGEVIREAGPFEGAVLTLGLVVVALVLATVALASLFRVLPPVPVAWATARRPAVVVAIALLLITRAFTLLAPRLFGANAVYGTLGAIFLGLAWLDLVFVAILLGAAWVADRVLEPRTGEPE